MTTRCRSPNSSRPDFNLYLRKSKEIPQRSSVLKSSTPSSPSLRSSFEQKENVKSRSSPSISSCSKGSKNFMAPTISAASKVTAASPRRKVLQERNEVINSVTDSIEFPNKELSTGVVIDDVRSKSEMGICSKEESSSVEVKWGEFCTKKFQNVVPPPSQIEPLDADPSLPPYDPKTNYLSPRPLFLHSRPNPRIEHSFNRDGRKLEDSFSLESSEDDVSENETHFISEPEPEVEIKPLACRPYKRSKLIPFLFVLVLACTYAPLSDSPVISSSMLKDHVHTPSLGVFDDLPLSAYLAVGNVDLIGLAGRIKHWLTDSIAYFSFLYSPPKDEVGLYHFFNTTPLAADESIGFDHGYKHGTVAKQSMVETRSKVPEIVKDGDVEVNAEETGKEVLNENTEMEHGENESGKIEMSVSEDEIEVSKDVMNANIAGYDMEKENIGDEGRNETIVPEENHNDLSHLNYKAPNVEEEVDNADIAVQTENLEEDIDDASSFDNLSGFDQEFQNSPELELLKSTNYETMLGFSLALAPLVLVSTLVFLYKKPKRATKKAGSVSGSIATCNALRKREGDEEEILSSERKLRRDSAASSSISYGSFTTYERRTARKGRKEEEVVTPVRRSSRINFSMHRRGSGDSSWAIDQD